MKKTKKYLSPKSKLSWLCLVSFFFLFASCDLLGIKVTITSPKEGDAFNVGETITFSGTAIDLNEGELTGESLVWEASGEDGESVQIGTGNSFTRDDLAEGFYLIFLTATNSKGDIGMEAVSITIGEAFPFEDNETDGDENM